MSEQGSQRPLGLVLVAAYWAVSAFIGVGSGILALMGAGAASGQAPGASIAVLASLGLVGLVLGVLSIAACYGIWTLQTWARSFSILLLWLEILLNLGGLLFDRSMTSVVVVAISVVIAVAILLYLGTPSVRTRFPAA